MFGQASKKELCFENLKITKNAWDSNIIQTNGKYLSVNWDSSGGGAFAVIPLTEVGKAPDTVSLFRGHKGPVLDTAFDPFNPQIIASCSDDGNIFVWEIPEDYSFHNYRDDNDNIKDILEPVKTLTGHSRKVGHVTFHPCAKDVLVSSSIDYSVKFWNVQTGEAEFTLQHSDLVTSFAFNYNGQLLATTSRDKKIRIWDLTTREVISEAAGHTGAKPSRVVWLGDSDRICTTGFSRLSDRQVGIWDVNDLAKGPIDGFLVIDSSSGVLIPIFDESTSILYLAGKGDGNIRYYEFGNDNLFELSQYASTDAQRGFAATPKMYVNMRENEILRSFKTVNDHSVEPISFIVPRKSELFQEDIYPDAPSDKPALTAEEWFAGKTVTSPVLIKMRQLFEGSASEYTKPSDVKPVSRETVTKQTPEQKTPEVKTEVAKKSVTPEVQKEVYQPPKSIDDAFKSSQKVESLLEKVNNEADEQANEPSDDDESEWTEVKKPVIKATEKEISLSQKSRTPEPVVTKPVESSKQEPVAKSAEIPEKKKETLPPATKTEKLEKPVSAQPATLRETVDKLAGLVSNLESQISRLIELNDKKDAKIQNLEERICKCESSSKSSD